MENESVSTFAKHTANASYVIPAILIVLVVGLIAYYFWPRDKTVLAMGPFVLHGAIPNTVYPPVLLMDQSQIATGFANNFTFSIYIYISDITKPVIGQQPPNTLVTLTGAGAILVDAAHASAQLVLTPTVSPGQTTPNDTLTIPNFLPARWNQLAFTIEGRSVDVYLNGVLVTSTLLENVPLASPTQITLNPQPGYEGQVGYAQGWPRRLTMTEIIANYKRTSDRKGKPAIPDSPFRWSDLWSGLENGFCRIGFCPSAMTKSPLQFIQYEF
jgi:hypothetical protein